MTEALAQQLSKLQLEMQVVQSQLNAHVPATKDLSLAALVPKWAGTTKTIPIQVFFESIEEAAQVGCWTQADKIRIAKLKLTPRSRYITIHRSYELRITRGPPSNLSLKIVLRLFTQTNSISTNYIRRNNLNMKTVRILQIGAERSLRT
jgi:hypothetical protein